MEKDNFHFFAYLWVLLFIFLDQISKYFFMNKRFFEGSFVSFAYSENAGSSFGMFSSLNFYSGLIIGLSIVMVFLIFYYRERFFENVYFKWVFVFLISGILGNLIDRIFYGYVRDFISFESLFVFNLADLYLNLVVVIYFVYEYQEYKKRKSLPQR